MKVLITGGAGYIGSTVVSACLDAGHEPIILDDLSTGRSEFTDGRTFYRGDIADRDLVRQIVAEQGRPDALIHCAARIVVPESVAEPLSYYETNVGKTLDLLDVVIELGIERFLFSSSASIYAPGEDFVVDEKSPTAPGSPYATTKLMVENVLADVSRATDLRVLSLRYFNPVGTDPKLRTGQQLEKPSHVMGKLLEAHFAGVPFTVTGTDWPTRDGSGIRDFIHVWDLARAHVAAVEQFDEATASEPYQAINLGTGTGTTVKELVTAFQEGAGQELDVQYGPARPGDVAGAYTRTDKARAMLGWQAELSDADGIRDAIAWIDRRKELLGY